jgi:hypothetical protein
MIAHAAKLMPNEDRTSFLERYVVTLKYGAKTPIYNLAAAAQWEKLACKAATKQGLKFMPHHRVQGRLSGVTAYYTFRRRWLRK